MIWSPNFGRKTRVVAQSMLASHLKSDMNSMTLRLIRLTGGVAMDFCNKYAPHFVAIECGSFGVVVVVVGHIHREIYVTNYLPN